MLRPMYLLSLLLVIFSEAPAGAQNTIVQGEASFTLDPPTTTSTGNANLFWKGVDQMYQLWFFYRIDGDAQETILPPPDSTTIAGNELTFSWADVDSRGFSLSLNFGIYDCKVTVIGCGEASDVGGLQITKTINNNSGGPLDIFFFDYLDLDVGGSSTNDRGGLIGKDVTSVTDGIWELGWFHNYSTTVNASPFRAILDQLEDSEVDDLSLGTPGIPFGPGDITLASELVVSPPSGSGCLTGVCSDRGVGRLGRKSGRRHRPAFSV